MNKNKKHTITVLGGGSFGTAVANMIAANGYDVTLWMRDQKNAEQTRQTRENTPYLPGYTLVDELKISSDLEESVTGSDIVFFSVPSKAFRQTSRDVKPFLQDDCIVVSTAKGVEAATFQLPSQILEEELPGARVAVMSGPNLAQEIANYEITATVIASVDDVVCTTIQNLLASSYFRVYANSDRFGVELAGALKNIYAIVSGIVSAKGMGQNTRSVVITRSLAEMSRFAVNLGANPMTFLGLSGVGDLYVTCTSSLSRNFRVGVALGEGKTVQQAIDEIGQVAEGVNTTKLVKEKADELGIYMPLATGLYELMFNDRSMSDVLRGMMMAEQNNDVEFTVKNDG